MANTIVRARIDEQTKEEAAAVLAAMGLTVSDAFRLMMVRIAKEKALPFEPLIPNAKTIAAIKEARRGGLPRHRGSTRAFLKSLNADD
ncbi:MAG TPA: type II toxin-antitoxin system RelB/DinJ family antitoxin [Hyphomicrobiaceae bacterium]|nr:type II toxin-antitoxin system RelB/DinJ family antitoxin [Hyphomicrobiaceae bacterium]